MQVACPSCGVTLECDPAWIGNEVNCPKCARQFQLKAPAKTEPPPLPVEFNPFPGPSWKEPPAGEGERFARQARIDLAETFRQDASNAKAADAAIARLRQELPEVPSAYRPSGALPAAALGAMLLGTVAGVPAGVLAESIVAAIAAAVVALILLLNVLIAACGFVWCFAVTLFFIIGLAALASPFVAGGWASAFTTTQMGRLGKNRNVPVAVVLSILSSALSILAGWFLFLTFARDAINRQKPLGLMPEDLAYFYLVLFLLGALVAMAVAGFTAADSVRSAKFCEECVEFMDQHELKKLTLGGLRAVALALEDARPAEVASLLHANSIRGEDGKVMLFACPGCGEGYMEATALCKVTWQDNGQQNKEENWLVASIELAPDDVRRFDEFHEVTNKAP